MTSPEMLRRFPLFAGLEEYFKELAMHGEEITLKNGDWLFHEGQVADSIYLVLSGSVELKMAHDSERIRHVHLSQHSSPGETIGWSALVEPHFYSLCAAVADDNTHLIRFNAEYIRDLMDENRDIGCILMYRLSQIMRERLRQMHIRFVSLADAA